MINYINMPNDLIDDHTMVIANKVFKKILHKQTNRMN